MNQLWVYFFFFKSKQWKIKLEIDVADKLVSSGRFGSNFIIVNVLLIKTVSHCFEPYGSNSLFPLLSICHVFEGAGNVPFQSYLNELIEDKILCMATVSDMVILMCKKNLWEKKGVQKKKKSPNSFVILQHT
jgi:hypothetical protein